MRSSVARYSSLVTYSHQSWGLGIVASARSPEAIIRTTKNWCMGLFLLVPVVDWGACLFLRWQAHNDISTAIAHSDVPVLMYVVLCREAGCLAHDVQERLRVRQVDQVVDIFDANFCKLLGHDISFDLNLIVIVKAQVKTVMRLSKDVALA
jgi:hypothetical protein